MKNNINKAEFYTLQILAFCLLFLTNNIFAQEKKPLQKLPAEEFTKFFADMTCKCLEPNFTGFSPKFMKIWTKIGKDFRTKGKTELKKFYDQLQNNKSDSLRFYQIENRQNFNEKVCDDNTTTIDSWEDKYDFDADKDFKTYLSENFYHIMNYLKKEEKCPNTYIVWTLAYIRSADTTKTEKK